MRTIERTLGVVTVASLALFAVRDVLQMAAPPAISIANLAKAVSALPFALCGFVLARAAARRLRIGTPWTKTVLSLALSVLVAAKSGAEPGSANGLLTVDDAVAIALQSNRTVAQAALDVKRAEGLVEEARLREGVVKGERA